MFFARNISPLYCNHYIGYQGRKEGREGKGREGKGREGKGRKKAVSVSNGVSSSLALKHLFLMYANTLLRTSKALWANLLPAIGSAPC